MDKESNGRHIENPNEIAGTALPTGFASVGRTTCNPIRIRMVPPAGVEPATYGLGISTSAIDNTEVTHRNSTNHNPPDTLATQPLHAANTPESHEELQLIAASSRRPMEATPCLYRPATSGPGCAGNPAPAYAAVRHGLGAWWGDPEDGPPCQPALNPLQISRNLRQLCANDLQVPDSDLIAISPDSGCNHLPIRGVPLGRLRPSQNANLAILPQFPQ